MNGASLACRRAAHSLRALPTTQPLQTRAHYPAGPAALAPSTHPAVRGPRPSFRPSCARHNWGTCGCRAVEKKAWGEIPTTVAAPPKPPRPAAREPRPYPGLARSKPARARRGATDDTFHRKPLPDRCVPFSSKGGRQLFQRAMMEGGLASYFQLAENFQTQSEPAFCGLGTLSMTLNSLGIDPGRKWKGVWRWYDEGMIECCVPLHKFETQGMSFDEFGSLARCNGAVVSEVRAETSDIDTFRAVLRKLTLADPETGESSAVTADGQLTDVLVASYNRAVLGQTGEGHFSPIAAYSPSRDAVLILDVARFKYPPHWVEVPLLWDAMSNVNPWNNMSRGWFVLSRPAPPEEDEQCPAKIRTWADSES